MPDKPTPILIKRYANRKLYNTEESKYINLTDIADMVRDDVAVQIIDNKSGEDVTRRMLAQMMVETEKKSRRTPYDLLQKVMHVGEPVSDVVNKLSREQGAKLVESLREEVESEVHKWVHKGEVTRDEIKGLFDNWQKNLDTVGHSTEQAVTGWFDKIVSRVQSNEIMGRISELEKRIEALEKNA